MGLIDFEWGRCIDGYRLTKNGSDVEANSERFESYRPMSFPVLFQMFLDTPRSSEGVLDFVSKFGALGGLGTSIFYANEPVESFCEKQDHLRHASELAATADWIGLVDCYNTDKFGSNAIGRLRSRLRHEPRGTVALVFQPTNLVQFMWLQFALHIQSKAKLLRCQRCGSPFVVGTGTGRRETAKFCSNACKVAAFRDRHPGSAG